MDRPLRVALLTGEHPLLGHAGGIGTYTATLAAALRSADAIVLTVVADLAGAVSEIEDRSVRQVGRWHGPPALRPAAAAAVLAASLARFGPDVVEAPNWDGLGGCLRLPGCPLVIRLSTPVLAIRPRDALRRLTARLHHTWERRSVRRARLVIADSAAVARLAVGCYGREADLVIPHPFPASRQPPQPALGQGVLCVGRLEHRKGTDLLLAAWRLVHQAHPDWTLHLVGADRTGYGTLCLEALGGAGVIAHGPLPADELARIARLCPVAVMPSRWESFGLAILEAWERGQAVVASDAGGLPEVVGEAGLVVPCGDVCALAAALARLIGSQAERRRLAEAGQSRLRAGFDPARCAAATLGAYRLALARDRRRP